MYLSQPAFSRAIQALEEEFGVQLFVRDKTFPRLTSAGEKVLSHMQNMFSEYRKVSDITRRISEDTLQDGTIVLGVFRFGLLNVMPKMTAEYKKIHPGVHFDLVQHTGVSIFPALKSGEIDLTHTNYIPDGYKKYLNTAEIGRHSFKAFLPASHPLAGMESLNMEMLAYERYVTLERRQFPLINSKLISVCANAGFSPDIVREFDTYTNLFDYIAEGKAIAVMAMPDQKHPGVVSVPVKGLDPDPTVLVWSRSCKKKEVLDFIEFIRQNIRGND